jgi:rhodanese-related sulfurtransferase
VFLALVTIMALDVAAGAQVPKGKETSLGLYVSAKAAYEMWQADAAKVKIIDVRTPEEYALIGHPEMAWNVPIGFITYERTGGRIQHGVRMNPGFVAEVKKLASPADVLLVMCRSGGRSAHAVNLLAAAGFTNVYNITDGMEGDKVDDPESVYLGKRMRNGWKNWGLPWAYSFDPEKILIEEGARNAGPSQ